MNTKPLYEDILRRVGEDDISLIKRVISNYSFIDYGIVQEYSAGRVSVKLAHQLLGKDVNLTNIEVLTSGSKSLSIRHELVKGDIVRLLSSKSLVDSVADLTQAILSTALPYSAVTIKAEPLSNFNQAKNKLDILDDGSYTLSGEGYTIEVTTDGTIKINGKALEFNGNTKSFMTYEQFNTAYQALINLINTHIHTSSGSGGPTSEPTVPLTSNISSAKTTTLKTGG